MRFIDLYKFVDFFHRKFFGTVEIVKSRVIFRQKGGIVFDFAFFGGKNQNPAQISEITVFKRIVDKSSLSAFKYSADGNRRKGFSHKLLLEEKFAYLLFVYLRAYNAYSAYNVGRAGSYLVIARNEVEIIPLFVVFGFNEAFRP
ncbi:unknown [Acidiphilium sp. CAG:727]|nr:unknown [Acidiphilium sp. CAG:727]